MIIESIFKFIFSVLSKWMISICSLFFYANRYARDRKIVTLYLMKLNANSTWMTNDIDIANDTKIPIEEIRLILRELHNENKIRFSDTLKAIGRKKQVNSNGYIFVDFDKHSFFNAVRIEIRRQHILTYLKEHSSEYTVSDLLNTFGNRFITYATIGQLVTEKKVTLTEIVGQKPDKWCIRLACIN